MAECPDCGTKVKVAPGKLAICPECEKKFRAPAEDEKAKKPAKAAVKSSAKAGKNDKPPAKPDPVVTEDMYGFTKDEEDLAELRAKREVEAEQKALEKKKVDKPILEVKRKNIGDLAVWKRIDTAMFWFLAGTCTWAFRHLLFGVVLFLGMIQGPEYAGPVVRHLIQPNQPPMEIGAGDSLDRAGFVVAMLGGQELYGISLTLLIIVQVLFWVQIGLWMTGYAIALPSAPKDYAGPGQIYALFTLGGLNFLFAFFFVFLPMVGAYSYFLMPWAGSEIAMAEYNMERSMPLHLFWSFSPFWETMLSFLLFAVQYGEPVMIAYFIWTVAATIKDEVFEAAAVGLVRMGCAVTFILLAYQLFAMAGSSPVLVQVLRIIYLLWFTAVIVWQLRLAGLTLKCRDVFKFYFYPDQE